MGTAHEVPGQKWVCLCVCQRAQCTYKKKEVNRLSTGTPVLFFEPSLGASYLSASTCPADGLVWLDYTRLRHPSEGSGSASLVLVHQLGYTLHAWRSGVRLC